MTLAQLRDAVLAAHQSNGAGWCLDCDRDWPCPEYRLATALSPENVAAGLRDSHHEAKWSVQPYGDNVPMSWDAIAAALLGAIPVDTQERALKVEAVRPRMWESSDD